MRDREHLRQSYFAAAECMEDYAHAALTQANQQDSLTQKVYFLLKAEDHTKSSASFKKKAANL